MLKARVLTALVLLILFGPILFLLPAFHLYVSFIGILTIAAWEWGRFLWPANKSYPIVYACVVFISLCLILMQHENAFGFSHSDLLANLLTYPLYIALVIWFCIVPVIMKKSMNFSLTTFIPHLTILGFFIFVSAFLAAMILRDFHRYVFLGVLALVWCADIGAYFFGKAFGKHKLAKNISPGKSWEGAFGGVIVVSLFILLSHYFAGISKLSVPVCIGLGVCLAFMSVVGDLFESLLKRLAKVKDSSSLLPGHGGVLDRIDAILPVLPIAALLLKVIL